MSSTNDNSNPPEKGLEKNNGAIVASPANSSGDGTAPQANVVAASRRLIVEQRLAMHKVEGEKKAPNANGSKTLHPSVGGPHLDATNNNSDEIASVTTATNSTEASDDIEKGKAGALVRASVVYPTATTVASFPHPEEHTRTANDRAVASILNADSMNDIMLVPGKIVKEEDDESDDNLRTKPMKEEPPAGHSALHTRKGVACLTLVLAAVALIVILCVTIPQSKARAAPTTPSSALEGSTGVTTPTEDNNPAPLPSTPGATPPPTTERWATLRGSVLFYGVTPEEILDDPTTPQHAALNWLANVDPGSSWTVADDVRAVQRYILATLYFSTGGEGWTEKYGWLSEKHECEWYEEKKSGFFGFFDFDVYGVKCDSDGILGFLGLDSEDTIVEVNLESNSLNGAIPQELMALSSLEVLNLSDNGISGSLSPELLAMPNLKVLDLRKNSISGKIPESIGTSVTYLDLSSNNLDGEIPDALWDMRLLTTLSLGDNPKLGGSIDERIGEMTYLQVINLGNLDLVGTIPESIGDLNALQVFNASHNGLTGPIPDVFDWLLMISELDLENNQLTGNIPDTLASVPHPMLKSINLQKNRLSGDLPAGLAKNILLSVLLLNDNELEGTVPWTWGTFMLLNTLTLDRNNLTGDIGSMCFVSKLTADCLGETPVVECPCCTQCCDADGLCDPEDVDF